MRYSLYINQPIALELGIENTSEAFIFDYLIIAPTWAEPIIIDNQVYYWVARQKICDEHPLLNLKPDTVYRYLKKLKQKNLINYIKEGKRDCISITKLGKKYISKTMSEKNPSKSGKKSESTRKKIRHINIPSYSSTNYHDNQVKTPKKEDDVGQYLYITKFKFKKEKNNSKKLLQNTIPRIS